MKADSIERSKLQIKAVMLASHQLERASATPQANAAKRDVNKSKDSSRDTDISHANGRKTRKTINFAKVRFELVFYGWRR
jgi:hypothetical protein